MDIIYKLEEIQVQKEHLKILRKHYETHKRKADQQRISSKVLEESAILLDSGLLSKERLEYQLQYLQEEFSQKTGFKQPAQGGLLEAVAPLNNMEFIIANSHENPYSSLTPAPSITSLNKKRLLEIEQQYYTVINANVRPKINLVGEAFRDQVTSAGRNNVDRIVDLIYRV